MIAGTREDAHTLRDQIAGVLATMGLRLPEEKTLITHIDEGLDFLGRRIQRHLKKGQHGQGARPYVYTYPAKKALRAICLKVKMIRRTTNIEHPESAQRTLMCAPDGFRLLPLRRLTVPKSHVHITHASV